MSLTSTLYGWFKAKKTLVSLQNMKRLYYCKAENRKFSPVDQFHTLFPFSGSQFEASVFWSIYMSDQISQQNYITVIPSQENKRIQLRHGTLLKPYYSMVAQL